MMQDLPSVAQLIKILQQVPYLASKNLYRVTEYFLDLDPAKMEQLCAILLHTKENVIKCTTCFCWQEKKRACMFCGNASRDQQTVCIVERWQELLAIEQTRGYTGSYHVLGGIIYPLEGVGPDDLTIDALVHRIEKNKIKEIIFALSQTPEGEATAAYIASKLKQHDITITSLARGLPVGSSLGSMDRLTVFKALSERRSF